MILFVTHFFPPERGGMQYTYGRLAARLNPRRFKFIVPTTGRQCYDSPGVTRVRFWRRAWPSWKPLYNYLRRFCNDKSVSHIIAGDPWVTGRVAQKLGLSYSILLHGTEMHVGPRGWRRWLPGQRWRNVVILNKILRGADLLIANSKYTAGLIRARGISENKIKVVYPAIETGVNAQNLNLAIDPSAKVLLTVARLVPRKGIDLVISAMPELLRKYPDLIYVIVGTGPDERRLKGLAEKSGANEKIKFCGSANDSEKAAWLKRAQVVVMPGREDQGDVEAFGISFLEANLYGKPVIAGRSGGSAEAVAAGRTGLLVDPSDKKDLIKAIDKLLGDPIYARELGAAGAKRVLEKFDISRQVRELEQIYQKYS